MRLNSNRNSKKQNFNNIGFIKIKVSNFDVFQTK